jgi:uncharacterized protein
VIAVAARTLVPGEAEGRLIVWRTPLSFWGGLDVETGRVIDRSHPACGEGIAGAILVLPSGRGSSSSSSVLAEAIRRGTAPAGLVLCEPDPILVVGAIVARTLYGRTCPVVVCASGGPAPFEAWRRARIHAPEGSPAAVTFEA